ncbi:MAG: hypothetical protein AAF541_22790 [Pseudomonadota bacterium]
MKIPATLVASNAEDAGAFYDELKSKEFRVIYKQVRDVDGIGHYTREFLDADIERLEQVSKSPVIFQQKIEGGCDVRVVVIGREVFAMSQTPDENVTVPDIRLHHEAKNRSISIPEEVKGPLLRLQRALDIECCAYDFMVDSEDTWFFIEANPSGQWLFVEEQTGQPLSECFAHLLLHGNTDLFQPSQNPYTVEDLVRMGESLDKGAFDRALSLPS